MIRLRIQCITMLTVLTTIYGCSKEFSDADMSFEVTNPSTGYEYIVDVVFHNGQSHDVVLFVLDPSSMLPIVHEAVRLINPQKGVTIIGVGFKGDNKRNRDYTPTKDGKETGEADEFFSFVVGHLHNELLARDAIGASSSKAIIGHSISGLASVYAFCAQNQYFNSYIIGSPSLWWDSYSIFEIEKNYRDENSSTTSTVFMGIGTSEDLGMQNAFEGLAKILDANYPKINLRTHLTNSGHIGSRSEIVLEGLKHILQ